MNPLPVLSSGSSASSTGSPRWSHSGRKLASVQTDQCRSSGERKPRAWRATSSDSGVSGRSRSKVRSRCGITRKSRRRATRRHSSIARTGSGKCSSTCDASTKSKASSGKGSTSPGATTSTGMARPQARSSSALKTVSAVPKRSALIVSRWKSLCAAPPISRPCRPSSQRCASAESCTWRRLVRTRRGWRSAKPSGWPRMSGMWPRAYSAAGGGRSRGMTRRAEPAGHGHAHGHGHGGHGHAHGLVDPSIQRSREGLRVVLVSLAILGVTAAAQAAIYVATGSVALLADLIHNAGDALTAVPLGAAFLLRSERAERAAGLLVVLAILASAVTAAVFAIERLIHPLTPDHLLALALAGVAGVVGNAVAARVRLRGGRRLDSPALVAAGHHARPAAIVSAGVVLSALCVALGAPIVDPLIGLVITALILQITLESWRTVRHGAH